MARGVKEKQVVVFGRNLEAVMGWQQAEGVPAERIVWATRAAQLLGRSRKDTDVVLLNGWADSVAPHEREYVRKMVKVGGW